MGQYLRGSIRSLGACLFTFYVTTRHRARLADHWILRRRRGVRGRGRGDHAAGSGKEMAADQNEFARGRAHSF